MVTPNIRQSPLRFCSVLQLIQCKLRFSTFEDWIRDRALEAFLREAIRDILAAFGCSIILVTLSSGIWARSTFKEATSFCNASLSIPRVAASLLGASSPLGASCTDCSYL